MKILVVDDEVNVVELVKFNLELNNFETDVAYDGVEALEKINKNKYDLVVLDNMLPGFNGFEIIKKVRQSEKTKKLPILMLTAKSGESDIIFGLNIGADDYLTKPFRIHELIARVNSILRRSSLMQEAINEYVFDDFTVYEDEYKLTVKDVPVKITKKEFKLLVYLIKHKNKVVSRDVLLNEIWGYEYIGETRTVDVHMMSLRKKIEPNKKEPRYIKTVIGEGYKFIG